MLRQDMLGVASSSFLFSLVQFTWLALAVVFYFCAPHGVAPLKHTWA